jgi:hypothetical protein
MEPCCADPEITEVEEVEGGGGLELSPPSHPATTKVRMTPTISGAVVS